MKKLCVLVCQLQAHSENPDQTGRLRVCMIFNDFWTRTGPYSRCLKDKHVQISEMGFRRFWARRMSCMVQKAPIHVGSTGPVFAPYWSATGVGCSKDRTASARARTASEGALPKPVGYTYGLMLYWVKNARTHSEPGERM